MLIKNEELGIGARISEREDFRIAVSLYDLDAEEAVPGVRTFECPRKAWEYARELIKKW